MAIPPVSTALPGDQLLEYFATLAESVDLPLIVQDASGYVGRPIPLEVCVQLLDRFGPDKILFKPEANPVGRGCRRCGRPAAGGPAFLTVPAVSPWSTAIAAGSLGRCPAWSS